MWHIYENRKLEKQLKKLPVAILQRYQKWKDIVEFSGLDGLKQIRGFHDEALTGNWAGYRSSRLNRQYRVIYQTKVEQFSVFVIDVNAHDYRS